MTDRRTEDNDAEEKEWCGIIMMHFQERVANPTSSSVAPRTGHASDLMLRPGEGGASATATSQRGLVDGDVVTSRANGEGVYTATTDIEESVRSAVPYTLAEAPDLDQPCVSQGMRAREGTVGRHAKK